MSMRGEIISGEYKKMVWVHDKEGKEYACYANDQNGTIKNKENLTEAERKTCLDLSTVPGDNWQDRLLEEPFRALAVEMRNQGFLF